MTYNHNKGRPPLANKASPFPFPHYEVVAVMTHDNSYDKKTGRPLMSYSARLYEVDLNPDGDIAWLRKEGMQFGKSRLHTINYGPAGGKAIDSPKGKEATHTELKPDPKKLSLFKRPITMSVLYLNDEQAYDRGFAYHIGIHHTLLPQRVTFIGNYPALTKDGKWRGAWQHHHYFIVRGGK